MDNSLIGAQITKFRKAAGMTQEELGRAVGVSTQAVSRWECGGAPDVTLLPAISDKLGVTIDALFGREGGQRQDIGEVLRIWAKELPLSQFFQQMDRQLWSTVATAVAPEIKEVVNYPASCFPISRFPDAMGTSIYQTDSGFYYGVPGENFSFSFLCHRPEEGYEAYLPEPEQLRAYLRLLSRPGCLETVLYLLRREEGYYGVDVLSEQAGISGEEMSDLLDALSKTGLICSARLGTLRGQETVYGVNDAAGSGFLALCCLARCLQQEEQINFSWFNLREKPILEDKT